MTDRELLEAAPYVRVVGHGVDVMIRLGDKFDREILDCAIDVVIRRRDKARARAAAAMSDGQEAGTGEG